MAQITITIPDAHLQRILNGFAYQHGYQDEIPAVGANRRDILIPNPETKAQFTRRSLKRLILQSVRVYESEQAAEQARLAKIIEVNTIIDLEVS